MIAMEAITMEEEYDEYDFLIKYICTGKSTEDLCERASEEGLDPEKVSSILKFLMGNDYITEITYPIPPYRTTIKIFDNHTCREIKELLKRKNLI